MHEREVAKPILPGEGWRRALHLLILWLVGPLGLGSAQTGSFTYQGRLADGGQPANGLYDLKFALRDSATGGSQIGLALSNAPTPVSNGLFTVVLAFAPGAFDGSARFLEIGVRSNGSLAAYTILAPRQPITASPYAILANTASSAAVASSLAPGVRVAASGTSISMGDSAGAYFGSPSYSNVFVGVSSADPSKPGSSILLPDEGGIFWADGSSIRGWNNHDGPGTGRNELQILGGHKLAFQCYNAGVDGGFQMGASGGVHDSFWFQYDTAPSLPGLGFSKLVQFVTRSGTNNAYAYSAIRAVAADTVSGMNTLNFYSGTPSSIDNSGGSRIGTMLTDGWDLRGRFVAEHATYSAAAVNVIDWLKPSSAEFQIHSATASFSTTNLPAGYTNNETRVVFIKSGAFSPTLTFPSRWHWLSESGSGLAPASLASGRILKLILTAFGPGDSNVVAEARSAPFP